MNLVRLSSLTIGVLMLAMAALAAGCATYSSNLASFRSAWGRADFLAARQEIDERIADEADVDVESVRASRALSPAIHPGDGDAALFLLERAMVAFAEDDPATAVRLLRRARDQLDIHADINAADFFASLATDDTAYPYGGADYERILVRVMLALADLIEGGGDAYAYALQVGEEQEAILDSDFGKDQGYQPRQHYRRVAIGAYLQGIMLENALAPDEAKMVYQRMLRYDERSAIGARALKRVTSGYYAAAGNGVVHVFYLAGRGPHLEEGGAEPTESAMRIAQFVTAVSVDSIIPLMQTDIPVPQLAVNDYQTASLIVTVGEDNAPNNMTVSLLDVNEVAAEQLEAMMPMILGRAVARRVVKSSAAIAGAEIGKHFEGDDTHGALSELGGALANLLMTATENADTRNWSSLPAEIQVARLELPEGEHDLKFFMKVLKDIAPSMSTHLRVRRGRDSYVVIIRPDLSQEGVVLVDRFSR